MKISEVLEKVKLLYPSAYDYEDAQLVSWCNEVTETISEFLMPKYVSFVQSFKEKLALPEGVSYEDVVKVYKNGAELDRLDARVYSREAFSPGDNVTIVYREKPARAEAGKESEAETLCRAPHDNLYVDFLCAQIAFYQNDLADYNKFIGSYNQRLADLEKVIAEKAPKQPENVFKNLW